MSELMSELKNRAKALQAQIEDAFANVPYPGDKNLYDSSQLDDDYDDVIQNLTGKHWRDLVPKRRPPQGRATPLTKDMNFCSAAAWHFFLPAYLISAMMSGKISTFNLEPARSEASRDKTERRFSRLSAEQCMVVVAFLDYAEVLLTEKQEKAPQYASYFEQERRELASVIAYWSSRSQSFAQLDT